MHANRSIIFKDWQTTTDKVPYFLSSAFIISNLNTIMVYEWGVIL